MRKPILSPEGLPWREYRKLQFLAAAPIAYPIGLWLEIVWRTSKNRAVLVGAENLPANAILYDFHVDVATNYITMHLLKDTGRKVIFVGSHDFDSYWSSGSASMGAYEQWRFDRRKKDKPLAQIVQMLGEHPDTLLGIFTDGAGGKRNRVRESLVKLALESKRPVVPFRSFYSPVVRLFGDDIPCRPGVAGRSVFGEPIAASELAQMSVEEARLKLEQALLAIRDVVS